MSLIKSSTPSTALNKGTFARSNDCGWLTDSNNSSRYVRKNDYIILNKPTTISAVAWDDIDFIYDASLMLSSMYYYRDLATGDSTLSGCVEHTYGSGATVSFGSMNRVPHRITVPDCLGNVIELN